MSRPTSERATIRHKTSRHHLLRYEIPDTRRNDAAIGATKDNLSVQLSASNNLFDSVP